MLASAASHLQPSDAEPIRAGFGAEGGDEHLQSFARNGLSAQFWCVRIAPQLRLTLDDEGRVATAPMDPGARRKYADHARAAREHGIDLYLVSGFFEEYVAQLDELGPYTKALVQGPTRYISPGEKTAPGPLEERYWLGQLLCEARFAAQLSREFPSVRGFLVDVEMYAGDMMWRWNSSFDDDTFQAAVESMRTRQLVPADARPDLVPREDRYRWLLDHGMLASYFSVEQDLVTRIARRFRQEIDAINPELQLGLLPYEANWFYDGWAGGLSRPDSPVLICSEEEYSEGLTPTSLARAERLQRQGIKARYVPGLMLAEFSPEQLGHQVGRSLATTSGYWLFTTYSLWQPEPEKLWGPYLIQAPREQYWEALREANGKAAELTDHPGFACPGYSLLTANEHYSGPGVELPLEVTFSGPPDVVPYGDGPRSKLFDGAEGDAFGTLAWKAGVGDVLSVVVDLSRECLLQRLRLVAGHTLPNFPSVVTGRIEVLSSLDGDQYYPMADRNLLEGRGKEAQVIDCERLGIRARYLKIVLRADAVAEHSVWAVSELAVWGSL